MGMPVITHGTGTRCQAVTDIIASVALEQAALAHILNAEGEKLQKVVSIAGVSHTQLLDTNKSVEKMVNAIARLEMVLQSKLELFGDCICTECRFTPTDNGETN